MHFGTTHEVYLKVFIILQNLVRIAAAVLIIRKFEYFACFASKCLFTPLWGFLAVKMGKMETFCIFISLGMQFPGIHII